jgi:hypothetical protein
MAARENDKGAEADKKRSRRSGYAFSFSRPHALPLMVLESKFSAVGRVKAEHSDLFHLESG